MLDGWSCGRQRATGGALHAGYWWRTKRLAVDLARANSGPERHWGLDLKTVRHASSVEEQPDFSKQRGQLVDALVEEGQKMLLLNFIGAIPAAVASVRCR